MRARRRLDFLAILLAAAVLIGIGVPCRAMPLDWLRWTSPIVGSSELAGPIQLEAGLFGEYHLTYYNSALRWIGYSNWESGTWHTSPITDPIFTTWHDHCLTMWFNIPMVCYYDETEGALMVNSSGFGWHQNDVDASFSASDMQLAIDSSGQYHLFWVEWANMEYHLMYGSTQGSTWFHETVAPFHLNPKFELEVAVDSSGTPHFVWFDLVDEAVKYAWRRGPNDYPTEIIHSTSNIYQLRMEMIAPDIPYVAFQDAGLATGTAIMDAYRMGGVWTMGTVAQEDWIYGMDMAVATEEGIGTEHWYYVYGALDGFHYVHWDGEGWSKAGIPALDGFPVIASLNLDWEPLNGRVGLALTGPSATEVSFLEGEPSTAIPDLTLDLQLNQAVYHAGDTFSLHLYVTNPGAARDADLYILLQVGSQFWFHPSWTQTLDSTSPTFPPANSVSVVLEPFTLPSPLGAGGPFYFHAGAFQPGTLDMATMISNIETESFRFE